MLRMIWIHEKRVTLETSHALWNTNSEFEVKDVLTFKNDILKINESDICTTLRKTNENKYILEECDKRSSFIWFLL